MQIGILSGMYTDNETDFRTSYPVNLVPVPKENGISKGYLRPAPGIVEEGDGYGRDRGGINWNGVCYRVTGNRLISIEANGDNNDLGSVGSGGICSFYYSFDRLGISSGGRLYYWDGTNLTQVTDPDLGYVVDFIWIDGYFMFTDGENIGVTELNDPMAIDPLKYGSSEVDPDPVKCLLKLQNEAYALNRHTVEVFRNIGGSSFPFQRIEGAQMMKGTIGTHTACVFGLFIAFMGGGNNEAISIYLGQGSVSNKISTREVDQIIGQFTEEELSECLLEEKIEDNHMTLLVHLPDRTLCYDHAATEALGIPVWYALTSTLDGFEQYRARSLVRCYNKWIVGDPISNRYGHLTDEISTQWDDDVRWEFGTTIIYNEGDGAIFHELELVALTGSVSSASTDPQISTSYSTDGQTWSNPRFIRAGKQGQRSKRLAWLQQGVMGNWRAQRFQGDSTTHISFARLEAQLEPLAVAL